MLEIWYSWTLDDNNSLCKRKKITFDMGTLYDGLNIYY